VTSLHLVYKADRISCTMIEGDWIWQQVCLYRENPSKDLEQMDG